MRQKDIHAGRTYTGDSAGWIRRRVVSIGLQYAPGAHPAPGRVGVLYVQDGNHARRYLDTFAQWAKREIKT